MDTKRDLIQYQELRVYDDEIRRPDKVNLEIARNYVQMGYAITDIRKIFRIYDEKEI